MYTEESHNVAEHYFTPTFNVYMQLVAAFVYKHQNSQATKSP